MPKYMIVNDTDGRVLNVVVADAEWDPDVPGQSVYPAAGLPVSPGDTRNADGSITPGPVVERVDPLAEIRQEVRDASDLEGLRAAVLHFLDTE